MAQKFRNNASWHTALAAILAVTTSSALYAVMTPAAQNSSTITNAETPQTVSPNYPTERAELPNDLAWHGEYLTTAYEGTFHLDPSLKHRLMYHELRKRASGTVTAETTTKSHPESFVSSGR